MAAPFWPDAGQVIPPIGRHGPPPATVASGPPSTRRRHACTADGSARRCRDDSGPSSAPHLARRRRRPRSTRSLLVQSVGHTLGSPGGTTDAPEPTYSDGQERQPLAPKFDIPGRRDAPAKLPTKGWRSTPSTAQRPERHQGDACRRVHALPGRAGPLPSPQRALTGSRRPRSITSGQLNRR